MSSILEKPLVFPTRALAGSVPVNITKMVTVQKMDSPNRVGSVKTQWLIVWQSTESAVGSEAAEIVWGYKDEMCRNTEYEEIRVQFGQAVTGITE